MTKSNSEQKRTMANADLAFKFIAGNGLTADPHTYEVVYTYVSQAMPTLNAEINAEMERAGGLLSQDRVNQIYVRSFAPTAAADNIENAGEKVTAEISKIMDLVNGMIGAASANADIIGRTHAAMGGAIGPDGLKDAIAILSSTAEKMQRDNSQLKNNLTESQREIDRLQVDLQIVRENSLKDPLTQVYNRKFFDDTLSKAMRNEQGEGKSLALLMVDIDHFKRFNDTYGHVTGDQVLRVVGNILPETTLQAAAHVADTIRRTVMAKELLKKSTNENLGRITLSIGVAVMRAGDTPEGLVSRADRGLYAAKRNGRNRVICETDPEWDDNEIAA
jgi:diguanylate cyclase